MRTTTLPNGLITVERTPAEHVAAFAPSPDRVRDLLGVSRTAECLTCDATFTVRPNLFDVFPGATMDNGADVRLNDAKVGRNHSLKFTALIASPDFPNVGFLQFRCAIRFSMLHQFRVNAMRMVITARTGFRVKPRSISVTSSSVFLKSVPSFRDHVPHVVCRRTKKQMVWIAARWVVAGMTNLFALGNRTICQHPCDTMSANVATDAVYCHNAVSSIIGPSSPNMAIARAIDISDQSGFSGRSVRVSQGHNDSANIFVCKLVDFGHLVASLGLRIVPGLVRQRPAFYCSNYTKFRLALK